MAEGGGILDKATDDIGQGIVDAVGNIGSSIMEKLASKEQEPGKDQHQEQVAKEDESKEKWNDLANEFSPESAAYGKDREMDREEKEVDMDER